MKLYVTRAKNAAGTYEMLKISYGLTCMNQASNFHWHKRFKDSGEELKDVGEKGMSE